MATLREDIEKWQTQVSSALATAKELYGLSNQLSGCSQKNLGRLIAQLKVLCEKAETEMLVVTKQLEEIKSKWGSNLDKWQRGLEDKLPKNENYDQDLESLLNTWKGDNWGLFSDDQKATLIYDEIRAMDDDISKICYHTGIPDFIITTVRTHVFFTEHLIAIGPNQIILSRFTPMIEIATLWKSATENPLDDDDLYEFERLLAHEYVEALLMASGLSFRSSHSEAWRLDQDVGWINIPNSKYYGSHDLAPLANSMRPPFDHWKRLGLAIEKLPLANNGNLPTWSEFDNLVNTIKQLLP